MLTDRQIRDASRAIRARPRIVQMGKVARVSGLLIEAHVPGVHIGDLVRIDRTAGSVLSEVVGFRDELSLLVPLSDVTGIAPGALVRMTGEIAEFPASWKLLGRAVDPFGNPVDGGPVVPAEKLVPVDAPAPVVATRAQITQRFETGVRAIDGLLTCGRGQRVGLFAGAGVGKTVLIRQIAEQAKADVTVIGLIGERGCEARDVLESGMGARSAIIVATSDRSPMERSRGARAATALAEFYRDQGKHVLLIIDSLTRYAMALREIGLSAGEPPATKGYPPSVFAAMPKLLERVSPVLGGGSITAFYTVLVEGDDLSDPVPDSARSLLDGHIVLSRDLAARGHFPAIDVLASASRVSRQVTTRDAQVIAERARALLATKREVDELKSLGAYVPGANKEYDEALDVGGRVHQWARQRSDEASGFDDAMKSLSDVMRAKGMPLQRGGQK
ncbi:FliI/YscN family ATPase [Myxococcota bacterium]|nr:FliI/YscN family ATPase [Myxococcota bacterium]